ncbi:hypothetical protein FFI39_018365 [Janthinobacterium sp. KBS0711]|uniref:hypothetical protein n=1 Tax=Janthinobacterium sp. KBS0711 TaxID=1649647 RepID=UPI00110EF776|nr:hypothetical protein [Janthinobacterium sp. KBS0711]TSD72783.1 hypothetical protein FFI39_018365 [Janthinobacterium sp. KBS0711]
MSIGIANAVPGPFRLCENRQMQSEKAGKRPRGHAPCAVVQRNSDVTFDVKNVSPLFHIIHFETLNETCNTQEGSRDESQGWQDAQ